MMIIKKKKKSLPKKSLPKLKQKLWKLVSEYVRRSGAVDGNGTCYTCGAVHPWKKTQAGHFQSRRHSATLFDLRNIKIQCVKCNLFDQGRQYDFGENLKKELGADVVEEVIRLSRTTKKFYITEVEDEIERYKELLKNL